MKETNVWKQMLIASGKITAATVRVFRNNVGMAYIGRPVVRITPANQHTVRPAPGDVLVRNARPFHAGLIKGSGDGIGWSTIEITPDMVGRKMAIFTSAETKPSKGGKVSDDQLIWDKNVRDSGGISVIARSPDDLQYAVEEFISRG